MKYKEITVFAKDEAELSALTEGLAALGTDQLIIADPADAELLTEESWGYTGSWVDRQFIEDLKKNTYVSFYLAENEPLAEPVRGFLKSFDVRQTIVDDQDWLHKWEEYYVPFEIAPGIVVKPVWCEYENKGGEIIVEIDPGLAFGTGSSPTTYLASRLLAKYMKPGFDMLDVGCGTGIQSVIGSKLGAAGVLAVDYDPEAVSSTDANVRLNGCRNIEARRNDLIKGLDLRVDLIVANLTGPLVLELCKCFGSAVDRPQGSFPPCCKKGTILIASGIIDDMEEPCAKAIEACGFTILETLRDDCWSAIAARYAAT